MRQVEIERKWLLSAFPALPEVARAEMEQGYLSFGEVTVRIRRSQSGEEVSYRLTCKGPGTLQRTEVELPLQPEQYKALCPLCVAPLAHKQLRCYRLPGGELLECSAVDADEEGGFYYAEVEFPDVKAAKAFQPPPFLGREVTEEPGFTMAAYCRRKAGKG